MTTTLGTDSLNIFRLLQLMNVVEQLAAATASHTHGSRPTPSNSEAMTGHGQQAKQLAGQLSPIIVVITLTTWSIMMFLTNLRRDSAW